MGNSSNRRQRASILRVLEAAGFSGNEIIRESYPDLQLARCRSTGSASRGPRILMAEMPRRRAATATPGLPPRIYESIYSSAGFGTRLGCADENRSKPAIPFQIGR